MESILARALEYTLKYWLKSFTRDQFKLQGRTVQLSNLDINGDAVHASLGLPPALNVTTAKVGKLEIMLPSVSNVQIEPIVVQIDKLDLVLEENDNLDARSNNSTQTSTSSTKGSGYGFADKIADGMTLQVHTVNLLLETHGGALQRGGSTWASPMASITIRNLLLYTTNESWQVVNLKEARDFSNSQNFIYVFKKLEWESLSVDLLPHPDMFADTHFTFSGEGSNRKDDDGAKRVFFGGERFIEGISGEAYITIQRTELNCPLGLEVQLHITEAVCPALSEPGLRAVLRFFTGLYVCLNRGDVNPYAQQHASEAAGRSLVSIVVDHIFLCVKDAEFQLELLMQSLFFCRASVSDGTNAKYLTRVMIGGLFLRDTFSRPFCTLVQPPMQTTCNEFLHIPDFGKNFCPPIYPLGEQRWQSMENVPLICIHSLQFIPTPAPPSFTSQTVIDCQPLMIHLQEESCQRISSFLSDGVVVNPGTVLPDSSVNSLVFNMKGLDITVPLEIGETSSPDGCDNSIFKNSFSGARLHIENLFFSESPSLKLGLLNLEKDPACFCLWEGQPIDASQKKWTVEASLLSLSLETCNESNGFKHSLFKSQGLLRCVELREACVEVAMVTADGSPLINVPPPGGIVRVGVACQQYISNTSVEQLFFVLDLYSYLGTISEKITIVRKNSCPKKTRIESLGGTLMEKVPGDTAVSFAVKDLQLRFLESVSMDAEDMPLVQFVGKYLSMKVSHRTLGGAIAISSSLCWESVEVDCAETEINLVHKNSLVRTPTENGHPDVKGYPQLRAVLWVQNRRNNQLNGSATSAPFLDLSMVHVIPYDVRDSECHSINISACVAGVCLGGGMNYVEALLHRFGILGPDGGPGKGFSKGIEHLSAGPLSKLFKASSLNVDQLKESVDHGGLQEDRDSVFLEFGTPDDVDVVIELRDWFFALEGAQEMGERRWFSNFEGYGREERCWHSTFQCLQLKAKSRKHLVNGHGKLHKTQICPIELVTVGVEGLQALKPLAKRVIQQDGSGIKQSVERYSGIDLKVDVVISEDPATEGTVKWVMENFKFSVKQPIEAVVSKDELQYLAFLCKSEVDSMGRITAGFLRVLKLEGSVGHAAINQLSNLGSEGFGNIFTSANSGGSIGRSANSYVTGESLHPSLESTVAALEEAVLDSQSRCAALTAELGNSGSSMQHLDTAKHLGQKFETMQRLLMQLRTQI